MVRLCHRCSAELLGVEGESNFCPHCGAPQLRVIEDNITPSKSTEGETGLSAGVPPPPHPGRVRWQLVLRYAALVAGIAGLSMAGVLAYPRAFSFAWLWTICGAVVVLGLYQRRHPEAAVDLRLGVRVGLAYGVMAFTAVALVIAAGGVIERFGLHAMDSTDAVLTAMLHQAVQQQIQQSAQSGVQPLSPDQLRIFYSAEFRAGMALVFAALSGVFLIVFSMIGGAIGGLMRSRRRF